MSRRVLIPGAPIVQLKVELAQVRPRVWRRVAVPAAVTLAELHEVLQEALGWQNYHLHEFEVDGRRIGVPDPDWDDGDVLDEATVSLDQIATVGARAQYRYDFGDGWSHDLTVEQIAPAEPGGRYPRCLGGARACPPEDVGGPGGYAELLAALRDPDNPDYAELIEWAGYFDPAHFDLGLADARLTRLAWRSGAPDPAPRHRPAPPSGEVSAEPDTGAAPITLRCTGKVLRLLRIPATQLYDGPAAEDDWYANVLWIQGRKCLLLTHAGTLFSVFLPDVRAADLRPIGAAVVPAIRGALSAESLPSDTFGPLVAMRIAKTADRRVLGSMNDLAYRCEWMVDKGRGLAGLDLDALHRDLQRIPNGARGFAFAIDLVRERLGEPPRRGRD
jgi:hypothetical protein